MAQNVIDNPPRHGTLKAYVPLLLWVAVIFLLGSSEGAFEQTSRFIRPLLEFLLPNADPATITLLHSYIRKFAHFFEYAVLAVLAVNAVTRFAIRSANWLHYALAFAVVLVTAMFDEGNQSFSRSRTGSVYDVLLDCFGGAAALLTVYLLARSRSPVTQPDIG